LERKDSSLKRLFGVCSLDKDGHDPDIPEAYFQTPPAKLESQSPSTAALRVSALSHLSNMSTDLAQFQYLSLMRFGIMMHKKYTDIQRTTSELEKRTRKAARSVLDLKDEMKGLKEKIKNSELIEVEYLNWKKREPEVRHYLKSFAGIAK
jgi:hypothetical protein